jgi:hypothetical protein
VQPQRATRDVIRNRLIERDSNKTNRAIDAAEGHREGTREAVLRKIRRTQSHTRRDMGDEARTTTDDLRHHPATLLPRQPANDPDASNLKGHRPYDETRSIKPITLRLTPAFRGSQEWRSASSMDRG